MIGHGWRAGIFGAKAIGRRGLLLVSPVPGSSPIQGGSAPASVAAENAPIQMLFERCQGWRVSFRDPGDLRTRFREFKFADEAKVALLVERTGMSLLLEDQQAFEHGLRNGAGGLILVLTEEQYRKLLR